MARRWKELNAFATSICSAHQSGVPAVIRGDGLEHARVLRVATAALGKACARGGEVQERRGERGGAAMDDMQGRVEARLRAALQPQELVVIDTSAGHCGTAFDVAVVSPLFEGKRLLERHRMVNSALSDELPHIHALSIKKAWTPEQMQAQQNK
ncbi:unnamed protein product [Closterium sp. NIES-54]